MALMKTPLYVLAVAALLSAAQAPTEVPTGDVKPQVPRKAENIGIQIAPEKYLWLSEYTGKTCIVACILTTCPHCQFTVGVLNRIAKDYAGKDVQILATAVEPDVVAEHSRFQKRRSCPPFPSATTNRAMWRSFWDFRPNDLVFFPQIVFIDRNGIIRAQFTGDDAPMNKDIQEKSLREVLEKTIKAHVAVTPRRQQQRNKPVQPGGAASSCAGSSKAHGP